MSFPSSIFPMLSPCPPPPAGPSSGTIVITATMAVVTITSHSDQWAAALPFGDKYRKSRQPRVLT